jgi:DNA-binding CsgD family transcriptional regulator
MTGQPVSASGAPVERLSAMEQACLRLVARRLSSKQIAAELGIAKTSVDTYCNRARAKLGVADRYEAARVMAAGLGRAGTPDGAARGPTASTRRKLALAALAVAVPLAVAVLIAGLRALDEMMPARLIHTVLNARTNAN